MAVDDTQYLKFFGILFLINSHYLPINILSGIKNNSPFLRRTKMSSIQSQAASAGVSPRQNALSDSQFSSYVKKQSLSAYESLDAGLTIKTKEGDLVTLTSSSYSKLDAFLYNSKGVLQTDAGKVTATQNQREITLTSGDSFTFSVEGDLSEQELGDIEAIVKGIDEVISQMAGGNMDDAVAKALSMGGYDTVSMYAADITYQKSYQMTSEVQAETMKNVDNYVEKMAERLAAHDDKLVGKAQKPVDTLFRHHLRNMRENNGEEKSIYNAIENARKQMEKMFEKMTENRFKNQFSAVLE